MPRFALACASSLIACSLLVMGCGNKSFEPFDTGDGGMNDLSRVIGDTDDLGDGGSAIDLAIVNVPGAPTVVIMTPASGDEVPGDQLTVTASITAAAGKVIKAGSETLTVTPPMSAPRTAQMFLTATANVYQGTISISDVPSGSAAFTVSATDLDNKTGAANGTYVHDHGPTLTFVNPTAMTAHGSVTVEIVVDDPLHPITMLSQVQAGIRAPNDITLSQVAGAVPFRVTGTVDLFALGLDGPQLITASATNDHGTTGKAQRQFTVDNAGPVISITQPAPGAFVGGVLEVVIDASDLSGVDPSTVVAVFGNDPSKTVALTATGATTYHGFFDVRSLGTSYVLPELSVRAKDVLGNSGQIGEEIIVDNTPPWMNMNAKTKLRVSKATATGLECSQLFTPLGPESTSEGDVVKQIITLRTRIEDHGNFAPGLLVERYSEVDPASVMLFAVHDGGDVLAVDTDGDGYCDDVNPALLPTSDVTMSGQALALALVQLGAGGSPDFTLDASPVPAGCDYLGESGAVPPPPLCPLSGTGLTFVLPYGNNQVPAVWTIPPVVGNSTGCVGFQLDSLNKLPEGPTCVVTRAADKAGNVAVSYPLHICIDRGGGQCTSFVPVANHCTGVYDTATRTLMPSTTCALPQNTFPVNGSEVVFVP